MSIIPISAVQAPCSNNRSRVHILDCGHTIEFEKTERCRINCKAIAKIIKEQNPAIEDDSRIICSRCEFYLWFKNTHHLREDFYRALDELKSAKYFQEADIVKQKSMKKDLIKQMRVLDPWWAYADELIEVVPACGHVWGWRLALEVVVDDLADAFGGSARMNTDGDQLMGEEAPAPTPMFGGQKKSLVPALKPLWMSNSGRPDTLDDALATMELSGDCVIDN